jgi:hypothetical protein
MASMLHGNVHDVVVAGGRVSQSFCVTHIDTYVLEFREICSHAQDAAVIQAA